MSAKWSRERCIEAAQEWHRRYGTPPGARHWNLSMARGNGRADLIERFRADGCWPHYSTITNLFGRWNSFVEAAGFQPLQQGQRRDPEAWLKSIRSRSVQAATHCKREHAFTPENTYVVPATGQRQCKECNRIAVRAYLERKKQSAPAA